MKITILMGSPNKNVEIINERKYSLRMEVILWEKGIASLM